MKNIFSKVASTFLVMALGLCCSNLLNAQVNSCGGAPTNVTYCYDSNESGIAFVYEADAGQQVSMVINAGTFEGGFDNIAIYEGVGAGGAELLNADGDQAGVIIESAVDGALTIVITSDGSVSCVSGSQTGLDFDIYCGTATDVSALVPGCDDAAACNFDPAATINDGSCESLSCAGCTDPTAFNFDAAAGATIDDGSCFFPPACVDNAYSFEMFDSFGDGWNGNTYGLLDDLGNIIATGTLDTATNGDGADVTVPGNNDAYGVEFFCLVDGCYDLNFVAGGFTGEISWTLTNLATGVAQSGVYSAETTIVSVNATCVIPGCTDPLANNFDPLATEDDGSCILPPANNTPCGATALACDDVVADDNTDASLAGVENADFCGGNIAPGLWYVFAGDGSQLTLNTCGNGTPTDTEIHAFTATDCNDYSTFTCIGTNDDGAGCDGNGFQSTLTVLAPFGEDVYVHVGRYSFGDTGVALGAGGPYTLEATCIADPCAGLYPSNTDCDNAETVTAGVAALGNTDCSFNTTFTPACVGFATARGIWYSYTVGSNAFSIDLMNLANDPNINVGSSFFLDAGGLGGCAGAIAAGEILCGGPVTGQLAGPVAECLGFAFAVAPGDVLYVNVWTSTADGGDFSLLIEDETCGCADASADNFDPAATLDDASCTYSNAPANDLCGDAAALSCVSGTVSGSTGGASITGAPAGSNIGVWYTYVGTGDIVTLSTCGSLADSALDVYTGECGETSLVSIASNDDNADFCTFTDADDAAVTFVSTAGETYFVYVSNSNEVANNNSFELTIDCEPIVIGCTNPLAENFDPAANTEADPSTCDTVWEDVCAGVNVTDFCFGNNEAYVVTYTSGDAMSIPQMTMNGGTIGFETFNVYDGTNIFAPLVASEANVLFDGTQVYSGASGSLTFQFETGGFGSCGDGANIALDYSVVCAPIVNGCTDVFAFNYDAAANADDGSCDFVDNEACGTSYTRCYGPGTNTLSFTTDSDPTAIIEVAITAGTIEGGFDSFTVYDGADNTAPVLGSQIDGDFAGVTITGTGNIITLEWIGDGTVECVDGSQTEFDFTINCLEQGCTESCACNYSATAGVDDGSCEFVSCQGCTYVGADNYDATATQDNGTCTFPPAMNDCPADVDGNDVISIGDLLAVSGQLGSNCP